MYTVLGTDACRRWGESLEDPRPRAPEKVSAHTEECLRWAMKQGGEAFGKVDLEGQKGGGGDSWRTASVYRHEKRS